MGKPLATSAHPSPIAIVAAGALTAAGRGVSALSDAMRANASALRPGEHLNGRGYQSAVGGWIPSTIQADLQAALPEYADARAFLLAQESLRQACDTGTKLWQAVSPFRRGFVLSTTKADIEALERLVRHESCSPVAQRHIQPAQLARDLALAGEIQGPIQCVSAACVSGLLALQQGASMIHQQQADIVCVTGVDLASHFVLSGFTTLKSLDPDGCRPFDRKRLGLSLGEGAGTLMLARADLCPLSGTRLTGWGSSNDANHLTGPSRDGAGLALAIERALACAGIAPDSVDYIHAHGTGTAYNDQMEGLALRSVFGAKVPPFSSSKGLFGHTLGAAGVLESILCWLALQDQCLPGTPRLEDPDPAVPESLLRDPCPQTPLRRVLKLNAGFSGVNAALVLERLC